MNRQELVEKIAAAEELPKAKAARVLQTVLDAVVETVKADEKLTLVGFGTFKRQARPARTGRNPSTGAPIKIDATNVPKFIPGAAFKAAVNAPKKKAPARKAKARK